MNLKSIFNQDPELEEKVVMVEVTSGKRLDVSSFPTHFFVDGKIEKGDETEGSRAFYFEESNGAVMLKKGSIAPDLTCLLFGKDWEDNVGLQQNVEYILQMNDDLYVFRFGCTNTNWVDKIDFSQWQLFDPRDDQKTQTFSFDELRTYIRQNELDWNQLGVCLEGMEGAFTLRQIALMPSFRGNELSTEGALGGEDFHEARIDAHVDVHSDIDRNGPLLSPYCWDRFDYGDILHISVDERLLGDPILGKNELLRFSSTRFDREGNAVDAYGNSCLEIADPHTRHRLPQGFLELPQYIFSVVGAPGSGKSNYLSVLINSLQNSLFSNFEMVMKDADPSHNAALNDMKNCLFGGGSIEQAALLKTQLEGKMYMKIQREDKVFAYPRPFVYTLGKSDSHEGLCNIVFYDNAGEHFEPGIETSISPGAQHVAAADSVFFMVDPTTLPAFRQRLQFHPDPQLKHQGRIDQQDVLLSEMEIRIHKALGLSVNEKIQKPLAILLGKCDIWMSLIDRTQFRQPIEGNLLSQEALLHNSNLVRQLLKELAPTIVANAESIADQVFYFPVSSFGHSPTRLPSGSLAPQPDKIKPYLIEIPTLWALSQKLPMAFKVRPKPPSARLIPS